MRTFEEQQKLLTCSEEETKELLIRECEEEIARCSFNIANQVNLNKLFPGGLKTWEP